MTSSGARARGRTMAVVVGVLTLLAAAVGARGVGSPARAASVSDLAGLRDQAVAVLDRLQIKGRTGYSVGIDPSRQRIGVYLFTAPDASPPDLAGLRAALGPVADLHTVTGTPQLLARVGGGEHVSIFGGLGCSAGFAIALRDGRQGILIAGHCFDITRPANQQHALNFDGVSMTGLEYSVDPSDWGILTLDKATDEAAGEVLTAQGTHPIRGVVSPTKDMLTCKSGDETATTCGTITLLDTELVLDPVRDDNGVLIRPAMIIHGLFQNNVCSEHGDSGAPVYVDPGGVQNAPVDAVGIVIGGPYLTDDTGKQVCVEKIRGPGTSVSYVLPLAGISATATNPFTVKTSS